MTITQLQYIVAVDNYRHFAKAAANRNVTQPTLSMQIHKLEQEIGALIFDRSKQPITPTQVGIKILEQARIIITETNKIGQITQEAKGNYEGEFRIGIIPTIAFVDTGSITITMVKDSTFERYNKLYQTMLPYDTVVRRVLGVESVRKNKFTEDFDINSIRYIPYSNDVKFELQAAVIERNLVKVSVFEASAKDTDVFYDIPERYLGYIDETHSNQVGSLTEPKISGNWQ